MPDKIPVHDSWGNKVGDFIPDGGDGCGGLIVLILAVPVLLLFGWLFVAIYKMFATTTQEAKEGKWGRAIRLSIFAIALFIVALVVISSRSEITSGDVFRGVGSPGSSQKTATETCTNPKSKFSKGDRTTIVNTNIFSAPVYQVLPAGSHTNEVLANGISVQIMDGPYCPLRSWLWLISWDGKQGWESEDNLAPLSK